MITGEVEVVMTSGTRDPIKPAIHSRITTTNMELITREVTMPAESKLDPQLIFDCQLILWLNFI